MTNIAFCDIIYMNCTVLLYVHLILKKECGKCFVLSANKKMFYINAKDVLIARAAELPANLLLEANTQKGSFEIEFLNWCSTEYLEELCKKAPQEKDFILEFFTIPVNSHECPRNVNFSEPFDISTVVEIKVSGKTVPQWKPHLGGMIWWVSVTLVVAE